MAFLGPTYTPTKLTPLNTGTSAPAPTAPVTNSLTTGSGLGSSLTPTAPPVALAPAPSPAPTSAPAPAPVSPPSMAASTGTYVDSLNKATDISKGIIGDTKAATISDPRSADMNQMLALMKDRLGGMTQQELQAEQESGLYNIDKQRAGEMEQYASIAGANGISGGAKASMEGQALRNADANQAALQRQLILDNVAQKNQALGAYSGALTGQQGVELGIGTYNANAADRDAALKMGMPFQVLSGMQGQNATDVSNFFGSKGIDTANAAIAQLGAPSQPASSSQGTQDPADGRVTKPGYTAVVNGTTYYSTKNLNPDFAKVNNYSDTWKDPKTGEVFYNPASGDSKVQNTLATSKKPFDKVICTETNRQGLLSDAQLKISREFGAEHMSLSEFKGYWTWGEPVVALMKRSKLLSRVIAAVLPTLISEEAFELGRSVKSTLRGRLLLTCFRGANRFFGMARRHRLSRSVQHG